MASTPPPSYMGVSGKFEKICKRGKLELDFYFEMRVYFFVDKGGGMEGASISFISFSFANKVN